VFIGGIRTTRAGIKNQRGIDMPEKEEIEDKIEKYLKEIIPMVGTIGHLIDMRDELLEVVDDLNVALKTAKGRMKSKEGGLFMDKKFKGLWKGTDIRKLDREELWECLCFLFDSDEKLRDANAEIRRLAMKLTMKGPF
jgi:hypothetical protein